MELYRARNTSTYIAVPLVTAAGSTVTSASSLDSEYTYWSDLSLPISMADCTNEAAEIVGEGIYSLKLVSTEMNHDYIYVQIKTPMAVTQHILLSTKLATVSDIWNEPLSQHSAVGVAGKAIADVDINTLSLVASVDGLQADMVSAMVDLDSLIVSIDALQADHVSLLRDIVSANTNVKIVIADDVSMMTDLDSLIVSIDGLQADTVSLMRDVTSLLVYTKAFDTSVMIDIDSLIVSIDGLQADTVSLMRDVTSLITFSKAYDVSIMTDLDSLIVSIDGLQADAVSILIDTQAILDNMAYGSTGVSVDVLSLANAVWDFTVSQSSTVGMAGAYLMEGGGVGLAQASLLSGVISGVASLASSVWDIVRASHTTAGTFGEVTSETSLVTAVWVHPTATALAQASLLATVDTVADNIFINTTSIIINVAQASLLAVVDTVVDNARIDITSLIVNVARASTVIGVAQASLLATVDTVADAIAVGVASLISSVSQANVYGYANWVLNQGQDIALASMLVSIDSIKSVPSEIAALNDLSAADVNAQVLDVLNVDTFAAPGQTAPSTTATLVQKIGYLHKDKLNKKEATSTAISLYDAAGTTVDQTLVQSDDGTTYSRGKVGSGP